MLFSNIILRVITALVVTVLLLFLFYKHTPQKLKPKLEPLSSFRFKTELKDLTQSEGCQKWLGRNLMLRRNMEKPWTTYGPHTEYQSREHSGFENIDYVRLDGCFGVSEDPLLFVGRVRDRGSGSYGWHVTFSKQGVKPVDFKKHQRFEVWLERDAPSEITIEGIPVLASKDRHYFYGLSDVIADEFYNGYFPPEEGDF